jgi:hypothetical protein
MENNYNYAQEEQRKNGSVIGGILGALLGTIIGAVIWAAVGIMTEKTYWIIGLAVGAIITFGYNLFKGRKGMLKIITIVVCVILAVVAGDLGYYTWHINAEYQELNTLLTTGTNDEIAEYFFTPDAYEEYKTLHVLDQNYNIKLIKDEYQVSSLVEFYEIAYQGDSEFKSALIKDMLISIAAGLFGGLYIAFKSNSKDSIQPRTVNFEEASENPTAEEANSTEGL